MNSHVTVQNVTILAPRESPNTDGIDPGEFSPALFLYMLSVNDHLYYSSLNSSKQDLRVVICMDNITSQESPST